MKEIFASTEMGLIGLGFFFLFFCAAVLWVYRPGAKNVYIEHGNIPLTENDE